MNISYRSMSRLVCCLLLAACSGHENPAPLAATATQPAAVSTMSVRMQAQAKAAQPVARPQESAPACAALRDGVQLVFTGTDAEGADIRITLDGHDGLQQYEVRIALEDGAPLHQWHGMLNPVAACRFVLENGDVIRLTQDTLTGDLSLQDAGQTSIPLALALQGTPRFDGQPRPA